MIDPAAKAILFKRHWSPKGWTNGAISESEFAYAKNIGLMFDPIEIDHHTVVSRALAVRRAIDPTAVGRAFLASLSTRRLELRSALGSLSLLLHFPEHAYASHPGSISCVVCGERAHEPALDCNVLSFERLKWGGVRHFSPSYAMLDLEWFSRSPVPAPTAGDVEIFQSIIAAVDGLPAAARPSDVEKALRGLLPSNGSERRILIGILGMAGILIPRDRPTFWGEFASMAEREYPTNDNDWPYPVLWWSGADGINRDAIRFWFPDSA